VNSIMMPSRSGGHRHVHAREAEFSCNALTGFNFGDGHMHDEHLIRSIQKLVGFKPGEFMVVWIESEPWGPKRGRQEYWIMDAAVGVIERGSFSVKEAVTTQPWLPDGPISTQVDWQLEGYERVRYPPQPRRRRSPEKARTRRARRSCRRWREREHGGDGRQRARRARRRSHPARDGVAHARPPPWDRPSTAARCATARTWRSSTARAG
jgi:hypothetical protein